MSVFSNLDLAQLREMSAEAHKAGKGESFDAAMAASGLQIPAEPDQGLISLHQRHGIEMDGVKPERYEITWRNPDTVTPAEHIAAKQFLANTRMMPGIATSIVSRVEELAPEIGALSERDRAERITKAQRFVGGEQTHQQMIEKARAVLQSGGDGFKFSAAAESILAVDPWMLSTLARVHDAKLALKAAIDKRGTK